ncbi:unnamed protein product [Prunus armeniaca]
MAFFATNSVQWPSLSISSRCIFQARQLTVSFPCVPWNAQYFLVSLLSGSLFRGAMDRLRCQGMKPILGCPSQSHSKYLIHQCFVAFVKYDDTLKVFKMALGIGIPFALGEGGQSEPPWWNCFLDLVSEWGVH